MPENEPNSSTLNSARASILTKQNGAPVPRDWGIPPGNWDYMHEPAVARNYDASLADNPVAAADDLIVEQYLCELATTRPQAIVADFGCGTGRTLQRVVSHQLSAIGIDLSRPMLQEAQAKLSNDAANRSSCGTCVWIQANLTQMEWLSTDSLDLGLCLFSTLGMLRGREPRQAFLSAVCRALKPQGRFLVHAHNLWFQTQFPGGWTWVLKSWCQSWFGGCNEFGGRTAPHRWVHELYLKSFYYRELVSELRSAGFEIDAVHPISDQQFPRSPVGWLLACRKQADRIPVAN